MAILLQEVPIQGVKWGWYTSSEPRMHLQWMGQCLKVFLEKRGHRSFEPSDTAAGVSRAEWSKFRSAVERKRRLIERHWTSWMIQRMWLSVRLDQTIVTVTAYPTLPTRFTRTFDLAKLVPEVPQKLALNANRATMEMTIGTKRRRYHYFLPDILWQD